MASFSTLVGLEFSKAIRRPMTWILAVIFIGFMGFMYTVLVLASLITEVQDVEGMDMAGLEEQLMLPDGMYFGSALVVGVGAVVMIVFSAGLFGSEFGWATIRTILLMRGPRIPLVFAKLLVVVIISAVLTVIGMVVAMSGSFAAGLILGDNGGVTDQLTSELMLDALLVTVRSTVAIAMWGFIGGMLALALSSMAIGTGIALAGYFIGDLIITLIGQVGTVGEWIVRLTPTYGINGMVQLNQITQPNFSTVEIIGMVASLIIWAIVFVALGIYRFRNMDVIAASN